MTSHHPLSSIAHSNPGTTNHIVPSSSLSNGTAGMNLSTTLPTLAPTRPVDRYDSPACALPTGTLPDWDAAYETQRRERWEEKTKVDLQGWRGGHGYALARFGFYVVLADVRLFMGQTGEIELCESCITRTELFWADCDWDCWSSSA